MKRRNPFSRSQPTPPLNDGIGKAAASLGEATKDLETALKKIEIALDKLEELSRLRREVVRKTTSGPAPMPTPSRPEEDEDRYPSSVPVYTANAIVPVLMTTFFRP